MSNGKAKAARCTGCAVQEFPTHSYNPRFVVYVSADRPTADEGTDPALANRPIVLPCIVSVSVRHYSKLNNFKAVKMQSSSKTTGEIAQFYASVGTQP